MPNARIYDVGHSLSASTGILLFFSLRFLDAVRLVGVVLAAIRPHVTHRIAGGDLFCFCGDPDGSFRLSQFSAHSSPARSTRTLPRSHARPRPPAVHHRPPSTVHRPPIVHRPPSVHHRNAQIRPQASPRRRVSVYRTPYTTQ